MKLRTSHLIISALIVSSAPFVLRTLLKNYTLIGTYPYRYMTPGNATDIFTLIFSSVTIPWWASAATIIGGCVASVALFAHITRTMSNHPFFPQTATMLFILAPTILYFSSVFSPYLWAVLLMMMMLALFNSKVPWTGSIPLLGLLFFDGVTFLSVVSVLTGYTAYTRKKEYGWLTAGYITLFILTYLTYYSHPLTFETSTNSQLGTLFSDFGSAPGFGIFQWLLAGVGLVRTWAHKKKLIPIYIILTTHIMLYTFVSQYTLLFTAPFIVCFAAWGLLYFWERKWLLPTIRFLTLVVLCYGLLFSAVAYMNRAVFLPPDPTVFESTSWMNEHLPHGQIVLSHPNRGFWINYNSGMTAFATPDREEQSVLSAMFLSRSLQNTTNLLAQHNITLIWIDQAMRNGEVWYEDDQGLLFLLRNERFKRIYAHEGIEVWRFR